MHTSTREVQLRNLASAVDVCNGFWPRALVQSYILLVTEMKLNLEHRI